MAPEPDPAEHQRRLSTRVVEPSAAHKRIEQMREELSGMRELRKKLK